MNRKGFFDLVDIFAFIFLCLLFTVFYIYFVHGDNLVKGLTQSEVEVLKYKDFNILLLNYLRTPIENDKTISDLLIENYIKNDYNEFYEKSKEILNKFYEGSSCSKWNIDIILIPENKEVFQIENKLKGPPTEIGPKIEQVSAYLPIYNDRSHFLKVIFYDIC